MHRFVSMIVGIAACALLVGCGLIRVEQDPFPPLKIQAERPAPPPARVVLTDSNIRITEKIQFEYDSADVKEVSFGLLDEIVQVMKDNPQLEKVQVEGHTDSKGGASYNRKLSRERAKSVVAYLIKAGVAKKRLVAKGFGPDQPIADNDSEEGRESNRRVEFNILVQGKKKTLIQED